jgi:hypothetical protein
MKVFMLAVIGLCAASPALAQDPKVDNPTALVRAMRADVIVLEASKSALSRAASEGHFTAAQLECFKKLPASAFTADLARFLTSQLTPEQIVEAIAFYESQPGIKFVDFLFETFRRESGGSFTATPTGSEPMTVDDLKAVRAFTVTRVGTILVEDRVLLMSQQSREITQKIVGKRLSACGARLPG